MGLEIKSNDAGWKIKSEDLPEVSKRILIYI